MIHELGSVGQMGEVEQTDRQNHNYPRTECIGKDTQHAGFVWHCDDEYHSRTPIAWYTTVASLLQMVSVSVLLIGR